MTQPASTAASRRLHRDAGGWMRAELPVALGTVALGAAILAGIPGIRVGSGYDRIGPRFFPVAVAVGLVVLGGMLVVSTRAGRRAPGAATTVSAGVSDWRPLAWLGVALVVCLILLESAGFVIATSLLFWLVARAFHSTRPARDAVVALLLSIVVYVAFSRGLGLTLPAGILHGVL